jgi:divalent metal cation (Fe/Co/Zn/Cd) transporter
MSSQIVGTICVVAGLVVAITAIANLYNIDEQPIALLAGMFAAAFVLLSSGAAILIRARRS